MKELNNFFIGVEEALRVPGYIPLVSTITGFVRILVANFVQGLIGALFVLVGLVIGILMSVFGQQSVAAKWFKWASFGVYQCVHASLSGYRGWIELFPVVGNLLVYFYDKGMKGKQLIPYPKTTTPRKKKK